MYIRILAILTILYLASVFVLTRNLPKDAYIASPQDIAKLDEQTKCLAQAVYFEARGEPFRGQIAVAQVVRNRVTTSRRPTSFCKIVFAGSNHRNACQFSFACDGKSDKPKNKKAWYQAARVAVLVASGNLRDLSGKATHYHATYVSPDWAKSLTMTKNIGDHIFYR
jgi:spore germination cell wall hydrolase CwlJ-like protein